MAQGWEVVLLTPQLNDYQHISTRRIIKKELRKKKGTLSVFFRAGIHLRWFLQWVKFFKKAEPNSYLDGIKMALELIYLSQEKKPQLIHVQWLHDTYRYAPLAEKWKIPLLVSIRGSQANYQLETTADGKKKFEFNARLATHFHVVGRELAGKLESLGIPKRKITPIYNGINREIFLENSMIPSTSGPLKLLTVGNFHPRKNHLGALSLLAELRKEGIDFEWSFIGEGKDLRKFQYLVKKLELPPHSVQFLKKLNGREMAIQYQKHHFFLGFSISEGLCNSVLEAMSCGCVPLVFQATGMNELIQSKESGFILPFGDLMEMKRVLFSFLPLGEKWQMIRQNSILASKNFPSVQESNLQWSDWYHQMLEGNA
jgi:glycosyltransferase involved in cell wall biosynthesis